MGKVIITGAGGFVGRFLTKKIVESGTEVIAISHHFGNEFPISPLITKIVTNIATTESLLTLLSEGEYDAFYHLAWRGINGPEKTDSIIQLENIRIALNCAVAARKLNCKKFLCAGSIAERAVESLHKISRPSGGMAYSVSKYCTHFILENYCKSIGLNFVWMQFSNIYGPDNKTGNLVSYTLNQLILGQEAIYGPAMQPYDFIFVDDLIDAIYKLGKVETTRNFYFIGSGAPRLLRDYLMEIGEIFGRVELIKIGKRPDDGIIFSMDMFDSSTLIEDVGEYRSGTFSKHIKYTIDNYGK